MASRQVPSNVLSVEPLSGSNFKKWKEDIIISLGLADLDIALRTPKPESAHATGTNQRRAAYEKWERSNRLSLLVMKRSMTEAVRGSIEDCEYAVDYLDAIGKKDKESKKAEGVALLSKFNSSQHDGNGNIREYIMGVLELGAKLNSLDFGISKKVMVAHILNTLPPSFSQMTVSYNTKKESWTPDELISNCVQEEERLRREKGKSVNFMQKGKQGQQQKGKKKQPYLGPQGGVQKKMPTTSSKPSSSNSKGSSNPKSEPFL
ncbi:uncharacterized protein LOC112202132 [Rosa chinensis]|uniref:uncharacterized protein LOC112202132 n=1 Tax=Rosa chinensis TaxID=74649 RepID=UPI000D092081|nr:uncharacterized protein LOC112202132 [Rosa chinensis]